MWLVTYHTTDEPWARHASCFNTEQEAEEFARVIKDSPGADNFEEPVRIWKLHKEIDS